MTPFTAASHLHHALRAAFVAAVATLAAVGCTSTPRPAVLDGAVRPEIDHFVLCGDSRPRLFGEIWRDVADVERRAVFAKLENEGPAFVLNTGDLVTQGDSRSDWARFDAETQGLRDAGIPYFAGLGNHDLAGDDASARLNFFARFPTLRGDDADCSTKRRRPGPCAGPR